MTKLYYPSDGVYKYCRVGLENCSKHITLAINNCSFDIPSGFNYGGYLMSLNGQLNNFSSELNNIDNKIKNITNNYENLEIELTVLVDKIEMFKIKDRDRMII